MPITTMKSVPGLPCYHSGIREYMMFSDMRGMMHMTHADAKKASEEYEDIVQLDNEGVITLIVQFRVCDYKKRAQIPEF